MQKKRKTSTAVATLRRRAEAQLRKQQRKQRRQTGERRLAADTLRGLHELQVHHIELEMQNAELQEARNATEALLQKYTELYDLAPIGYFSLNEQGRILEVNLAGAALLGVERARLVNRSLTRLVTPATRPSFLSFLDQIFCGPRRRLCEATLLKANGTAFWASFHGTSAGSDSGPRKWCRVAVSDITIRKQAEYALQATQHELERRVEERTAELQRYCVLLAREIEERKQAEEDVAKELHFETLLAEISTRFVNLPPRELDGEIVDSQRRIFELLGLDVSGFWQWSAEASGFFRLHYFSRSGDGPQLPEQMSAQEYLPWFQQQVLAGRTIAVCSIKELPPEAARDRKTFRQFGFKANLTIPLSVGGEPPVGALGFTTRTEREWPAALVKRLQLVAQIFANALARKRADQALRGSEERLSSIYNTVEDAIFRLEVETEGQYRFISINQSFCRITGLRQEQVVGKTVTEVIAEPSLTMVLGKYRQAIEAKTIVRWEEVSEYPAGRLTGEVSVTPILDDTGKCTHLVGSVHDITQRKRAEDALRASDLKYRNVVEMTGTGYVIIDLHGRVLDANQEYVRISGHRELREIIGRSVIEWTSQNSKQRNSEAVAQCAKDGFIRNFVTEYTNGSGKPTFVEINATVEMDAASPQMVAIVRDITYRKQAHDALAHLQRQNELILNSAAEGIVGLDSQGNYSFVNLAAARILGYEAKELLGRPSHSTWHHTRPDGSSNPENECKICASYREGKPHRDSTDVFWRKDGSSFPVEYATTPIYEEGRLLGAVVTFEDITVRKRAEEALLTSEELSRVTFEQAAVGIAHAGLDGRWLAVNDRLCDIVGFQRDELIKLTFQDITHPDDLAKCRDYLRQIQSGEISTFSTEGRYIRKDGSLVWVNLTVSLVKTAAGAPLYNIAVVEDITERKRAEEELQRSEERLRLVLEANSEGVWDWNIPSGKAFFSRRYSSMLGYEPEEFPTDYAGWKALVHPDDFERVHAEHVAHIDHGKEFLVDFRLRKKSGDWCWVRSRGTVVERDAERRAIRMVGTHEDITERKQTEAELLRERAELAHVARVSTMGELAASLAHELNQPLGAILANAEAAELFLQENPPRFDDVRAILTDIRKDDERAGEVIRRMRAMLRKRELDRQPLEINSMVQDALQLVSGDAALRGVALTADLVPALPKVSGDRVYLQQVLLNLILNGMDAMVGEPRERRRISVRTRLGPDRLVELAVIDSGHGIEPDKLPRIFEPFYTTKPNGMGMGLSIARTIVDAHHGRIWAENNPSGGGAVIRIALPVVIEEPRP